MTLWSQQNITGVIIDKDTQNPLENAHVYDARALVGTYTDALGEFSIAIGPATEELYVSLVGYATTSFATQNTRLQIEMSRSLLEIDEVIVSAPFHQLESRNITPIERINIQDLQQSGAATLSQALEQFSGVRTISTGNSIGKPTIRGLSGNRIVVYHQNARLENQQFGDEHGLGVSFSGVSGVEVIRGPASLLYGSDALGGVVYLSPERFAYPGQTRTNAEVTYHTNTVGYSAQAGHAFSGEKWGFLASLGVENHSDYESGSGERITNTRFRSTAFNTGIKYGGDKYNAELRYSLNRQLPGIPEEFGFETLSKRLMLPNQEIDHHSVSLSQDFWSTLGFWETTLGYTLNDRNEFEEEHGHEEDEEEHEHKEEEEGPALAMKLGTWTYDIRNTLHTEGDFEQVVGLQGLFQNNKNNGFELLIPDAEMIDLGLYWLGHLHKEKLDIQLGVRYDHRSIDSQGYTVQHEGEEPETVDPLSRSFNSVNLSLGANYMLSPKTALKLNVASGFRAPNLSELTSNGIHHGTNRFERGNMNLHSEKGVQLDAGLHYDTEKFSFEIDGFFYGRLNDYIILEPTGEEEDGASVYEYQQEDATMLGTELMVHYHPTEKFHFKSSFEWLKGELVNGGDLPLQPASQWKNEMSWNFNSMTNAFFHVTTTLDQENVSQFETRTGGYTLLDAGMNFSFNRQNKNPWEVRLLVTNITNKDYISHLSRLKSEAKGNIGRNIVVGIKRFF